MAIVSMALSMEEPMPATETVLRPIVPGWTRADADEAVRREVMDACFEPDRAHHDELGHTDENGAIPDPPASPREQPAAAMDVTRVDE
jgi:hypothetical protein